MQFTITEREKPIKLRAIISEDQYVTDNVVLCADECVCVLNNLNLTDLDNS